MSFRFWLQGLQAIGASCRTLLGPQRNVKAVLNPKDPLSSCLVGDTLTLLDALDIEHPVAQLLLEVCNGQQKVCGNGCATLVNMAAGWSRAVQTLTEQGIPIPVVLCLFDEVLQICEETCRSQTYKLQLCLKPCQSQSCDTSSAELTGFDNRVVDIECQDGSHVLESDMIQGEVEVDDTDWFFSGITALEAKLDAMALSQLSSPKGLVSEVLGLSELQKSGESDIQMPCLVQSLLVQQGSEISTPCEETYPDTHCSSIGVPSEENCEVSDSEDDFSFDLPLHNHSAEPAASMEDLHQVELCKMEQENDKKSAIDFESKLTLLLESKSLLLKPSQYTARGSRHLANFKTMTKECGVHQSRLAISSATLSADENMAFGSARGQSGSRNNTIVLDEWVAVERLCSSLAHGMEFEMSLAIECLRLQWKSGESPVTKFDVSRVFAISISGPNTCHSQVVRGVVVRTHLNREIVQAHGRTVSILVVIGDISPQFRHAGFKTNSMIHQVVAAGMRDCTGQQLWLRELEQALKRTNVGLVSVQGQVDSAALDLSSRLGIAIVDGVNSQQQTALCNATGATKLTYLHLAQPEHVGKYVTVSVYNGDTPLFSGAVTGKTKPRCHKPELARGKCCVIMRCVKEGITDTIYHSETETANTFNHLQNVDVCTSVICAPSSDVAAMMERNFWKCSHRISNCLSSECILPGSGQIEFFCRKQLQLASRDPTMETTGSSSWVASQIQPLIAEFRPVAYVEFATAFETYIGQTAVNMGRYSALHSALGSIEDTVRGDEQGVVYDDFRAKPEAWKRAGNLVKLLFQTGNVVLSGGWSQ